MKVNLIFAKTMFIVSAIIILAGCNQQSKLSPDEAKTIAKEAYIYGFPMVMNYKTMYMYTLNEQSPEYRGPFNQKACAARLFTPDDKAVVTPNSDTPYCMFWVDIRNEPLVISLPEMEDNRYYHFQLIDLFTYNYAYLGTLTTGNKSGKYMVVGRNWKDEKSGGIDDIIVSETDLFFIVVRTQLMDNNDLDRVKEIQDSYGIQSLSSYLEKEAPVKSIQDNLPAWQEGDQFTAAAFVYMDAMLDLIDPIDEEKPLLEKFRKIGVGIGEDFNLDSFTSEVQDAIQEGVKEGMDEIQAFVEKYVDDPLISAKVFGTRNFLEESARDNFGLANGYLLRAVAAQRGLYGNSGAEATYPTYIFDNEGKPLDASKNNYTITFEKDALPPVKAFWSVTMYDGSTQLFIKNPLNRYLLNSTMMDDYILGANGSLTLYIQKDSPGKDLEPNWLPAPDGPFYCVMRLYGPEQSVLDGEWSEPPLVKTDN